MPLFVYECKKCHAEREILVRGSAAPKCPECGSKNLVKQASAIAPLTGSSKQRSAPAHHCSSPSCCRAQGGGCGMN